MCVICYLNVLYLEFAPIICELLIARNWFPWLTRLAKFAHSRLEKVFDHEGTGQVLDKDHAKLACALCHANLKFTIKPTCGDAACHKSGKIEYPARRPGPESTARPLATLTRSN